MTLHLFIPESEKEKERPCGLKITSSQGNLLDLTCEECKYHPSYMSYNLEPRCLKGRDN